MKKNIVFLYSGEFSDQSALSVADFIEKNFHDCNAIAIERRQFSNFGSWKISNSYNKFTARHLPVFNRFFASLTEKFITRRIARQKPPKKVKKHPEESFADKYLTRFYKMDNIIFRFNPEVIVCATPYSFNRALKAKERLESDVKVVALMSDYCLNKSFLKKQGDGYLVQNEIVRSALIERGVSRELVKVVGTPVFADKLKNYNKEETKVALGIENDNPCILLSGGRQGSCYIRDAFSSLTVLSEEVNLICLTGGNKTYSNYISNFCKANQCKNIYMVEEIDDISKLYTIADIAICSPSAATTYEVVSRGIPLVLIKPLNNIEKGNFSYLTASRLAIRGVKGDELLSSVYSLLKEEEYRKSVIVRELDSFDPKCVDKAAAFLYSFAEECRKQREEEQKSDFKEEVVLDQDSAKVDDSKVKEPVVDKSGEEILNEEAEDDKNGKIINKDEEITSEKKAEKTNVNKRKKKETIIND